MITFEHRRMKQLLPRSPSWDLMPEIVLKAEGLLETKSIDMLYTGYFKTLEHMAKYRDFFGRCRKNTKLSWNGIGRDSNEELEPLASGG